jgi:hypothetical protein
MRNELESKTAVVSAEMLREIGSSVMSDYAAPEMVSLGRSENLIQGSVGMGFSDSSNQWFWHQ